MLKKLLSKRLDVLSAAGQQTLSVSVTQTNAVTVVLRVHLSPLQNGLQAGVVQQQVSGLHHLPTGV